MKRKRIQQAGVLVLLGSSLFLLLESLPALAQSSRSQPKPQPRPSARPSAVSPAGPLEVSLDRAGLRPRRARRPEIFFCQTAEPQCRTSADTLAVEEVRDLRAQQHREEMAVVRRECREAESHGKPHNQ